MSYKYPRIRQAIIDFIQSSKNKVCRSHIAIHLATNHEDLIFRTGITEPYWIHSMLNGRLPPGPLLNMIKSIRKHAECEKWCNVWWYGSGPFPQNTNCYGRPLPKKSAKMIANEKGRLARKEAAKMIVNNARSIEVDDVIRPHMDKVIRHISKMYRIGG